MTTPSTTRSGRLPSDLAPTRLAAVMARVRTSGRPVLDLTESNPTRVGLRYPPALVAALADPHGLDYEPSALGIREARTAVVSDFARRGVAISPDRIVLTASTSEAYGFLFKLLCAPGDRVLVPQPSYPLFEHLTALDAVVAVPYPLDAHADWRVDVDAVARSIDARTRAVLVVSPNNPTGSVLDREDLDALATLAAERGVALIGDEVFADYEFGNDRRAASVLAQDRALAFGLGGLSKSVGLPQMKVAWIGVTGPDEAVHDAMAGLEVIADTYLSVSTPAQLALPTWLATGADVRQLIRDRCARNLAALAHVVADAPAVSLHRPVGGWTAVLQVPAVHAEEALVIALAERDGVLVHPGYFFEFPREAFVVLSLLVEPRVFDAGVARLIARATEVA